MRSILFSILVLGAVGRSAFGQDARAELELADRQLGAAWQSRNVDRLMAFYHDSAAISWTDHPRYRGTAAIRSFWVRTWSDSAYRVLHGTRESFVLAASGDLAWMQGTSGFRRSTATGVEEASGSWVTVWRRVSGRWVIVSDNWNRIRP
jgi:ketosteroid isomerase-like protein